MRNELRAYVIARRGAPKAVWGIDETGILEKGHHSAGVARQYSGTAGRIEHGQIGVFLADASHHGQVLRGRERPLPQEWTDDPACCQRAGIPQDRRLATKPKLAQ